MVRVNSHFRRVLLSTKGNWRSNNVLYILKNGRNTSKSTFTVQSYNPISLRTAKTKWSFDCSECNWVKTMIGVHKKGIVLLLVAW